MANNLPEDIHLVILTWADRQSVGTLSAVSKAWRRVCLPEIFRKVDITGTWVTAEDRVNSFLQSREICKVVRCFVFVVNVKEDKRRGLMRLFSFDKGDRMVPRRTFPHDLAKLLASMIDLRILKFSIPCETVSMFEDAFSANPVPLMFESIRGLSTDTYCHFLVDYCPGLRAVGVDLASQWRPQNKLPLHTGPHSRSESLIRSLAGHSIQFFSLWDVWTIELTSVIAESMPNLTALQMLSYGVKLPLQEHLAVLKNFKSLRQLEVLVLSGATIDFSDDSSFPQGELQVRVIENVLRICPTIERLVIRVPFDLNVSHGNWMESTNFEVASMMPPRLSLVNPADQSSANA
ncbi:hypothetical protein BD410DRAFT_804258 [Rickenella mellea]|uniref:F-box domain-containing protein n=1 Tax=Rickenella mellea TaxID=50990 RepID=A0A4Y7Q0Z5_9AGAM|nr:hypothetical protein BD410DRAFT_804258 [Rickenella mellea]